MDDLEMIEQGYTYQVFGLVPFVEDEKVIISTGGVAYSDGKSFELRESMVFGFQDYPTVIVIRRDDESQTIMILQFDSSNGMYEDVKFIVWKNKVTNIVIARTNPK